MPEPMIIHNGLATAPEEVQVMLAATDFALICEKLAESINFQNLITATRAGISTARPGQLSHDRLTKILSLALCFRDVVTLYQQLPPRPTEQQPAPGPQVVSTRDPFKNLGGR